MGRCRWQPEENGQASAETSVIRADERSRTFHEIERESYRAALDRAGGNVSRAARLLGITRPQLDYRLRRLGLR